jgi:anthranilate phosphoribosyltransferase
MLGPMVNPSNPKKQMVGVYSLQLLRLYAYLYQKQDKSYAIVHALDGYDEISLTKSAKVVTHKEDRLLKAEDFGVSAHGPETIFGGNTVEEAASIFTGVLENAGTKEQVNTVCANAALAISVSKGIELKDAFEHAKISLQSGMAYQKFKSLINLSNN